MAFSLFNQSSTNLKSIFNLCIRNHEHDVKRLEKGVSELDSYFGLSKEEIQSSKGSNFEGKTNATKQNSNSKGFGDLVSSRSCENLYKKKGKQNDYVSIIRHKKNYEFPQNEGTENQTVRRETKSRGSRSRDGKENKRFNERTEYNEGYGQNFERSHRSILKQTSNRRCKRKFKRTFSYKRPISFSNMSSMFVSANDKVKPSFINSWNEQSVRAESEKAFQTYTKSEEKLSRNMQFLICRSISSSFDILGIPLKVKEKPNVIPFSIRKSVRELGKSTNSGFPHFKKKNNKLVQKDTIRWIEMFLKRPHYFTIRNQYIKSENSVNLDNHSPSSVSILHGQPTGIFHRTQISPISKFSNIFETKIRPVWNVPYTIVSLEYMFFKPLVDFCRRKSDKSDNPVYPTGCTNRQLSEKVALPMHRRLRRRTDKYLRSFDFSKFDRNIRTEYTSYIFTLWGTNLKMSENHVKAYNALRFYTCYTPFIFDDRIMLTRRGVCSGSYTTNVRDTIVNLSLVISALTIKYGCSDLAQQIVKNEISDLNDTCVNFISPMDNSDFEFSSTPFNVFGDDGIIFEDDDFFLIHKFICNEFSLNIKYDEPVKSGESFFFLGRFWDEDGLPWQTDSYIMAHIQFRSKWYSKNIVEFDISEKLDLYRVLSICCPLRDGLDFLFRYFSEWDKFTEFVENGKGYYLLKEWPNDEYSYIDRDRAFNVMNY